MGWLSSSSPFDLDVERATDMKNTTENWGLMMDLCDKVSNNPASSKDCLRSITRRLHSEIPQVQKQALTLLDVCINNCGKPFHLEVASREFEPEIRRLITKCHPGISEKAKSLLKKWAEGDFKTDPQLNLIPSLYKKLRKSGVDFSAIEDPTGKKISSTTTKVAKSSTTALAATQKEADDLAKAIELSLQETKKQSGGGSSAVDSSKSQHNHSGGSLYPTAKIGAAAGATSKETRMVRALYDFEAAEDNELTFYTGEIIQVLDDTDANWWKGSNQRGEGLFPANFVTSDLQAGAGEQKESASSRKVQFRDSVEVRTVEPDEDEEELQMEMEERMGKVEIDEEKMRVALKMLHDGDPTCLTPDPPELAAVEGQCLAMGPLIDTELEKIDRKHAVLARLSSDLVEALNLYHTLMRSSYSTEGMVVGVHGQPYMHPGVPPSMGPVAQYPQPGQQPMYNPYAPQQQYMVPPEAQAQVQPQGPVPTSVGPVGPQQPPMGIYTHPQVAPSPGPLPGYAPGAPPVAYPPHQYPPQVQVQPQLQPQLQHQQPQAPYYGVPAPVQMPHPSVNPAPYYPGYSAPPMHPGYDPKMAAMDPNQGHVYSQPMQGYDPNMMSQPRSGTDGMAESFAAMAVNNAGEHQGHHVNSITNHHQHHHRPPLL